MPATTRFATMGGPNTEEIKDKVAASVTKNLDQVAGVEKIIKDQVASVKKDMKEQIADVKDIVSALKQKVNHLEIRNQNIAIKSAAAA